MRFVVVFFFFSKTKNYDIFAISPEKHILWYSLEVPRRGASNEYPKHTFLVEKKENTRLTPPLK